MGRLLVFVLLCGGCGGNEWVWQQRILTAPSGHAGLAAWRPCVVVHNPGGVAFPVQMEAVARLQRAGAMQWIRLDTLLDGNGLEYHHQAQGMGLRIFNIIHMKDLEAIGWEEAFDRIYAQYPGDIWEIAGEITHPNPAENSIVMEPEVYMEKFRRLYAHVRTKHPHVVLASAPTLGNAGGPQELERFFELGLLDLDVVIALNVYTDNALVRYRALFGRYAKRLIGKRIWVTETAPEHPTGREYHIDHVERFYPRLRDDLHPEMVCWYSLWDGDEATSFNGYGMLNNVRGPGPLVEGPLFVALTAGAGGSR